MKSILRVLMFVFIIQHVSLLANDDYKCRIERLSFASGDQGKMYEMHVRNYVGKEFAVSRSSGLMTGTLKNSYTTDPVVIDYGSTENSYKVITTMTKKQGAGEGTNIYALTILEYEKGTNKPFVFLENDVVYFGTCSHF